MVYLFKTNVVEISGFTFSAELLQKSHNKTLRIHRSPFFKEMLINAFLLTPTLSVKMLRSMNERKSENRNKLIDTEYSRKTYSFE